MPAMDPLSQLIDAEDRARLATAIQQLPELERMALRMVDVGGFSARETAGCMGIRPKKVNDALNRARAMLKARLS
jgi:RNA polymerase sigma factor (sigma-70 family)